MSTRTAQHCKSNIRRAKRHLLTAPNPFKKITRTPQRSNQHTTNCTTTAQVLYIKSPTAAQSEQAAKQHMHMWAVVILFLFFCARPVGAAKTLLRSRNRLRPRPFEGNGHRFPPPTNQPYAAVGPLATVGGDFYRLYIADVRAARSSGYDVLSDRRHEHGVFFGWGGGVIFWALPH